MGTLCAKKTDISRNLLKLLNKFPLSGLKVFDNLLSYFFLLFPLRIETFLINSLQIFSALNLQAENLALFLHIDNSANLFSKYNPPGTK